MVTCDPLVVWPAPGMPALAEGRAPGLRVIVAVAQSGVGNVARWAERLVLRETLGERRVSVVVESVTPISAERVDPKVQGFARLQASRGLVLVEVCIRPLDPLRPDGSSPVCLYDLCMGRTVVRERSVAVFATGRRRLRLAFASDLHLASFWDVIGEAADRFAPDLAEAMLHPARLLDRFIDEANELWSRDELDLVVLGGDLVEFVHDRRPGAGGGSSETNVHALLRALRRLRVPSIAVPGNHDYRAFPWRPRIYGLASIGIPTVRRKLLLKQAGLWDRWPVRPSDKLALRTENAAGDSALAHHLQCLAPATDFEETLHGTRLIFATTGRDLITRWRSVGWARRGLLMRSLRHCVSHPDSEGLSQPRVAQIASSLSSSRGAAVFFHSPLLNPPDSLPVERHLDRLDPGDGDDLATQLAFERRLRRGGLRRGVFFHNPGMLVRALVSAGGPVATFSGHSHRARAIEFNRRTLALRSASFGQRPEPEQTVTMLTAPALGQSCRTGEESPGYLLAAFEDGRLVSVRPRTVG
jgi:hypothetical protein